MSHRQSQLRRKAPRGTTLIEGLMATVVFMIGMIGITHAAVYASSQTSDAQKKLRANAIAAQTRVAIETIGYNQLTATNNLLKRACETSATTKEYAGGLQTITGACVIDLDTPEATPPTGYVRVLPTYSAQDAKSFKRVLVVFPTVNTFEPPKANTTDYQIAVVVSWKRNGFRRFTQQILQLPNPLTYDSNSQI